MPVGSKLLKYKVSVNKNEEFRFQIVKIMMASDELWFLTKWLDQLDIVSSEKDTSEATTKKRKRSGTDSLSMASDSGFNEDADGELKQLIQANGGIVVYS